MLDVKQVGSISKDREQKLAIKVIKALESPFRTEKHTNGPLGPRLARTARAEGQPGRLKLQEARDK